MKILLAVDGSASTQKILDYVTSRAPWLGTVHEYTVLHVVPALPVHLQCMAEGGPEAIRRYYEEEHEKVFAPIREPLEKCGVTSRWQGEVGVAAELISAAAQAGGFDLIIMGSRGLGAVKGLLLGSVATKVLAMCETPVLLIR